MNSADEPFYAARWVFWGVLEMIWPPYANLRDYRLIVLYDLVANVSSAAFGCRVPNPP